MDARLAARFAGVIGKRLSSVECYGEGTSNQGEIGVGAQAPSLFGTPSQIERYGCDYLYLSDTQQIEERDLWITYQDSRRNDPTRGPEWRMTYPRASVVMREARSGDLIWVARDARDRGQVLVVVAEAGSEFAGRLDRILGLEMRLDATVVGRKRQRFADVDLRSTGAASLDADDADLMAILGVEVRTPNESKLDLLLSELAGVPLAGGWPSTRDFSAACRRVAALEDPLSDVDQTMAVWFALTNELFFLYEKYKIQPELDAAFANRSTIDVDAFFRVANSLRGRRSSRAGNTFEWHLADLVSRLGIRGHMKRTLPDGTAPDFIFPSADLYLDPTFQAELLTVLAAKTTLKERWQQVVNEGKRHAITYLATMDRGLNASTLATMRLSGVIPVTAKAFIESDYSAMSNQFMTFADFFEGVQGRQLGAVDWGISLNDLPLLCP
ncbi:type II restriction endonuclease [Nocardioides jejuensis]|uniref:Restriction endonuclease type II EcoRII C-terminal domain-containing protein n=1 Tax=Nocardioides jejuensis TaxID=2502782 RepID=A0A4R1CJ94_9ACTN|nr:type II restriction endonuclease [Nocardioides jejuensis]TCJ30425.1 hypothetical protein EPD65_04295 [Nocardioides jejuensis]